MRESVTMADLVVLTTIEGLRRRAADTLLGDSPEARLCGKIADDIERQYRAIMDEEVTIAEAERLTGYDASSIRRMVAEQKITLRRRDLPRKPGHGVDALPRVLPMRSSLSEQILHGAQSAGSGRRGGR